MNVEKQKGTYRYWMFTWNNPSSNWVDDIVSLKADYVIAQLEIGEEGTPHIQGCCYLLGAVRHGHWKKFPIWIKGISSKDFRRVSNYSSKSDSRLEGPIEQGQRPSMAGSKDWETAYALAKAGRTTEIEKSILIPYYGNIKKIVEDSRQVTTVVGCRGIWIYGPPGVGKTHYVRSKHPGIFVKSQNKWWDTYNHEDAVCLEDLDDSGKCLGHYIKIWADKWGFVGEVKGGPIKPSYSTFYVTSNYLPSELWDGKILAAIVRRFGYIHMPTFGVSLPVRGWSEFINSLYTSQFNNL